MEITIDITVYSKMFIRTNSTLNFAHYLVIWDGLSRLVVRDYLRLFIDFLKQKNENENRRNFEMNKYIINTFEMKAELIIYVDS